MKKISSIHEKDSIAEITLRQIVRLNSLDSRFYDQLAEEKTGIDLSDAQELLDEQKDFASELEVLLDNGRDTLAKNFNKISKKMKESNILPGTTDVEMDLLDAAIEHNSPSRLLNIIMDHEHNRRLMQRELNLAANGYDTNKENKAIAEKKKCTILPFKPKKPTARIYKFERNPGRI